MTNDFNLEDVVSNEYRKLLEKETKSMTWGGAVNGKVPKIVEYANQYDCKSILDYGSGKSDFLKTINAGFPDHGFQINEYEPGRPELAGDPVTSDMTVCVDVMEHIEPLKLDAVLDHIALKTTKILWFQVCLVPSFSTFEDGRNLHLIIEDKDFWLDKLSKHYTFEDVVFTRGHVWGLGIKK